MATKKKFRLALIGLGNQGLEHLQGEPFSERCCFVAGVDPDASRHAAALQHTPEIQLFDNLGALLAQREALRLDGLVLCLPHHAYITVWPELIATGLPMLKEKPLGRNLEEARYLSGSAQRNGLKTAIQRRHHASYLQLKSCLTAAPTVIEEIRIWLHLGRPLEQIPDALNWRTNPQSAGGGILLDAGYHLVDLLHFYLGPLELVNSALWQSGNRLHAGALDDRAQLLMRTNRTWVFMDARLDGEPDKHGHPAKSEGIEVLTRQGLYYADRTQVKKDGEIIWEGQRTWVAAMGRQLDDFASAIETGHRDDSAFWDQIPAMRLIEQAYQHANWF